MDKQDTGNQIKIELSPEVASGHYANLAVIAHGANEFFLDFITLAPNTPQAKVQSRIVMTPENAKNLLAALQDNIRKYETTFGEIKHIVPKGGPTSNTDGTIPNPFMA